MQLDPQRGNIGCADSEVRRIVKEQEKWRKGFFVIWSSNRSDISECIPGALFKPIDISLEKYREEVKKNNKMY